jgi:hypothetical protein
MSFVRLTPDDFVVSSDAISSTCWTTGNPTLTSFYTSSTQVNGSSGDYYINVFDTPTTSSVQFAIAYGNAVGSGSENYSQLVNGKSPTATVFGQWQDLVIGDENTNFIWGNTITGSEFFALPIERQCYKESLFLGSLTLRISSSQGVISLTDNSNYVTSVQYTGGGTRVFQLITGSAGVVAPITSRNTSDGYSANSGSYGWLLPDIGTILLNPMALAVPAVSGGIALGYSGSFAWGPNVVVSPATSAPNQSANISLLNAITSSNASYFQLNSQETITSDFVFVRPRSSEFNYSENPSFISGSTGEVLYSNFINNPQTYITTIGLYNDTNELLAVAKLSRPLSKNFTKEALVRVKLDF